MAELTADFAVRLALRRVGSVLSIATPATDRSHPPADYLVEVRLAQSCESMVELRLCTLPGRHILWAIAFAGRDKYFEGVSIALDSICVTSRIARSGTADSPEYGLPARSNVARARGAITHHYVACAIAGEFASRPKFLFRRTERRPDAQRPDTICSAH